MPVYNAERYLPLALDSILQQTFHDFEFVLVDDGSTDGSPQIMDEYALRDPRIRILRRPNTGIVGALNDGLAYCRGKWIARLDADDWSHPERLARQMDYFLQHPELAVLGCRLRQIDPDGDVITVMDQRLEHESILEVCFRGRMGLSHGSWFVPRELLLKVGGYRAEYEWAEDLDLLLRLSEHGRLANLEQTLVDVRMHPTSVSHRRAALQRDRAVLAVEEACLRQGLPAPDPSQFFIPQPDTVGELHRKWASRALRGGEIKTARKLAWRAVRHSPWAWRAWVTLAKTFRPGSKTKSTSSAPSAAASAPPTQSLGSLP